MDTANDRKNLFRRILQLIIFIFIANSLATKLYWYSSIWWFDMPMHFLGGLWLGMVAIYRFSPKEISLYTVIKIFLFVLLIGVGWEIFEIIVNNIIAQNPFNALDTVSDVFFDLSGGAFALLYFLRKINKRTVLENRV